MYGRQLICFISNVVTKHVDLRGGFLVEETTRSSCPYMGEKNGNPITEEVLQQPTTTNKPEKQQQQNKQGPRTKNQHLASKPHDKRQTTNRKGTEGQIFLERGRETSASSVRSGDVLEARRPGRVRVCRGVLWRVSDLQMHVA